MAYTPKTWECGEIVTADSLNNLEEGVQEALECCSGGGAGYTCEETYIPILSENVTTSDFGDFATGTLSQVVNASDYPVIKVAFGGEEYEVSADANGVYGDITGFTPDFTRYPFVISSNNILTETAGTYNVVIEGVAFDTTTTSCFAEAVKNVLRSRLRERLMLFENNQAFTINANSHIAITLNLVSGYSIPTEWVHRALVDIRLDVNHPQIVLGGFSITNVNNTVTLELFNTGDTNIQIEASNNGYRAVVMYLTLE